MPWPSPVTCPTRRGLQMRQPAPHPRRGSLRHQRDSDRHIADVRPNQPCRGSSLPWARSTGGAYLLRLAHCASALRTPLPGRGYSRFSRARPASKRNGLIAKTTHSCCHCSGRRVRFTSCFRPLSLLTYPISNGNHPTYTLINSIFNSLPAAYAYSRIRSPASWDYLTAHRTTSSRSGCI